MGKKWQKNGKKRDEDDEMELFWGAHTYLYLTGFLGSRQQREGKKHKIKSNKNPKKMGREKEKKGTSEGLALPPPGGDRRVGATRGSKRSCKRGG